MVTTQTIFYSCCQLVKVTFNCGMLLVKVFLFVTICLLRLANSVEKIWPPVVAPLALSPHLFLSKLIWVWLPLRLNPPRNDLC